jgi:hypothetical protein
MARKTGLIEATNETVRGTAGYVVRHLGGFY